MNIREKLYINDDGSIDMEKYLKIIGKSVENKDSNICPCCGGSGKVDKNC